MESPSKSCDLDPIPTELVKKCISITAPAITGIINNSLSSGVVPLELKRAVILPTLKKVNSDKETLQNYRPISNLPFLGKTIERVGFSQLTKYLQENDLLDCYQSAYRSHHSVETLLLNVTDNILKEMDEGNVTAVILLDMSAAFDTVVHDILVQRLKSFGICGIALQWLTSYLTDRTQSVKVSDVTSDPKPLTCGVPQGSVGGPLLFSLYLYPISKIFQKHRINYHCYADDIQVYISFKPSAESLSEVTHRLELCLEEVRSWLESNGLKLNDSKTEFILFGSKHMLSKIKDHTCNIRIGNAMVEPTTTVRNLGVVFDRQLTFKNHISYIAQSVRFHLRNLSFIRIGTCQNLLQNY